MNYLRNRLPTLEVTTLEIGLVFCADCRQFMDVPDRDYCPTCFPVFGQGKFFSRLSRAASDNIAATVQKLKHDGETYYGVNLMLHIAVDGMRRGTVRLVKKSHSEDEAKREVLESVLQHLHRQFIRTSVSRMDVVVGGFDRERKLPWYKPDGTEKIQFPDMPEHFVIQSKSSDTLLSPYAKSDAPLSLEYVHKVMEVEKEMAKRKVAADDTLSPTAVDLFFDAWKHTVFTPEDSPHAWRGVLDRLDYPRQTMFRQSQWSAVRQDYLSYLLSFEVSPRILDLLWGFAEVRLRADRLKIELIKNAQHSTKNWNMRDVYVAALAGATREWLTVQRSLVATALHDAHLMLHADQYKDTREAFVRCLSHRVENFDFDIVDYGIVHPRYVGADSNYVSWCVANSSAAFAYFNPLWIYHLMAQPVPWIHGRSFRGEYVGMYKSRQV